MTNLNDALNLLDWIRDDWDDADEWAMTRKLYRFEAMLLDFGAAQQRGLELHAQLCRARIAETPEWRSILVQLRTLTASVLRRPELVCGFDYGRDKCRITCASEAALAEHRERVHGLGSAAELVQGVA